ncbi:RluA family pseudouridine synthase [Megasphaera hominis]|mgnify:FL=1|jgi:23S rRNA pseudouridine1911/1915/1917 synthase|uniref:Pseudouridine synthase n=1 Tax=Megasphaera hominis TaxID=159836 RepID=A0ABR6VKI9_9FIRM|nr:RluA family pseudouridine synthase [Megasphaera hominis]MBC3537739.1 RluA family pseudouridine synthase [Megasphaera hominis]
MIQFTVGSLQKKTSLLGALRHFGVSSTMRRRIKHSGVCKINGHDATTKDFVVEGDRVEVTLPEKNSFTPEAIPLTIAYEDDYIIVVNKPAGLLMHPTSGAHTGTLANALAWYYEKTGQSCAYHPMHRLDRNTSGLCLIAKQPQIQYAFSRQDLAYHRFYAALCEGVFPAPLVTVHWPIERLPGSIIQRRTGVAGKAAHTDIRRLAACADYSLLEMVLHTGRTHQIRVHCASLGHPLVGDDLYGGSRRFMERQALHAFRVQFIHPVTGNYITVNSPLPADMQALVHRAGWDYNGDSV